MRAHEDLRRDTLRFVLAAIRNEEKARLGAAVDKLNAEGKDEPARQAWLAAHRPGELEGAAGAGGATKPAKKRRGPVAAVPKGGGARRHPKEGGGPDHLTRPPPPQPH